MANATAKVNKGVVGVLESRWMKRSVETLSAETTYYVNAMIGIDSTGYYCKGDDTQSWLFAGVVRGKEGNVTLASGTAGDAALELDIDRPEFLDLILTSVAATDIGKPVYATFDNQVSLAFGDTTYANVVGWVIDHKPVAGVSNIARVALNYDGVAGHRRCMAAKRIAATGATTISRWDMGKTIFCANTAAKTVTLPAVATIPAGQQITFVKDHASDANILTLAGDGSENIDGANTLTTIDAAWDCATLVSNESRWIIISRDIA